jgi:molybdopterin synthase sulfur carrier subunit
MIRVQIPYHLQTLARLEKREVELPVETEPTIGSVLDALEARYPMLRGTLRDQVTQQRRPFIRFFACGQDWSLEAYDTPLPAAVVAGREVFRIVGAMAGG